MPYAVRIAAMIMRTVRFLCVIYAEISVNATAARFFKQSRAREMFSWFSACRSPILSQIIFANFLVLPNGFNPFTPKSDP